MSVLGQMTLKMRFVHESMFNGNNFDTLIQINSPSMSCYQISEMFKDSFVENTIYGGDIIKGTDMIFDLSECINKPAVFLDEDVDEFTENIILLCDEMINQTLPWNEIGKEEERYISTSNILDTVDTAAYQLLANEDTNIYTYNHITVFGDAIEDVNGLDYQLCYEFSKGKICVRKTALESIEGKFHGRHSCVNFAHNNYSCCSCWNPVQV